jgi:hypothetical protein
MYNFIENHHWKTIKGGEEPLIQETISEEEEEEM